MDKLHSKIKSLSTLTLEDIRFIAESVTSIFLTENTVLNIQSPIKVVGDIHGQFVDLLSIFSTCGEPPLVSYLFLGDYVDRGPRSLETICYLFTFKCLYPNNIFLLRGNHETREMTKQYGFYDEIRNKFNNVYVWRIFQDIFDLLPLAAIIDNRYFCVHGGISPQTVSLDVIRRIPRLSFCPITADLIWSDPDNINGFLKSSRGSGYLYGEDVSQIFLQVNDFSMMIRSHQLVFEGYRFHFSNENVLTVWSAPDYCGRCINHGSVLSLTENHFINENSFTIFHSRKKK